MLAEGVIALREFELSSDTQSAVTVTVNRPFQVDNSWRCEFAIRGPEGEIVFYGMGADSLQAVVLALENIASLLYTSEAFKAGQLTWLGQRNLGLPTAKAMADLVPD